MADFNKNLWAPWRMEYIRSLGEEARDEGCFLCRYWEHPEQDRQNRVIWRTDTAFVVLNRFPYTNGHLLVSHAAHKGDVTDLSEAEFDEMNRAIRGGVSILRDVLSPQGFNIGYNLGLCAGAGLPDHLHAHVVPRWPGDTNYMAVVGDTRVVPDSLDATWAALVSKAESAGLR